LHPQGLNAAGTIAVRILMSFIRYCCVGCVATALLLGCCGPSQPAKSPAAQPQATAPALPAPPPTPAPQQPSQQTLRDRNVQQLIAQVEKAYANGEAAYRKGRVTEAKAEFDRAVDLLLTTGWGVPPLARGSYRLLRNVAPSAHWLEVTLVGRASNRPGLGACIAVEAGGRRQNRFRSAGTLYSQSLLPEHFGLGNAVGARVRVRWPSGTVQEVSAAADLQIEIVESHP